MTSLNEIIKIREDIVFGGAVQTDWYYDNKGNDVAKNFVFHGPDFFGVTEDDVEFKDHRLMDTCTFTNMIADRLYGDDGNPLIMTIAGYGTGKSHLAVTLGKYFSSTMNDPIRSTIYKNIYKADKILAGEINKKNVKPNLVLMLNGMRDFNLNYEIMSSAKKVLKQYGYSDEFFSDFTIAYSIASMFLSRNYENFKHDFQFEANKRNINSEDLKSYMIENIYSDDVFDSINEVYSKVTGNYIRWDEGISAGEVLRKLNEKLCGDNKEFNKILILFDEFGRYIEYVAEYPHRAGDSALQQVFEAIQDSNNQIVFVGFIQSDLKTYLARVSKSSNVSRYIGRYETSEKIYLSSNLETIFANLLDKHDVQKFNHYIKDYFDRPEIIENNKTMFNNLNNWVTSIQCKGIWKEWGVFNRVIVQGIYPLHPVTTLMITSLSDWYQQRSALNFLIKSFPKFQSEIIKELGDLPIILPVEIVKSDFFEELLLAEKEGRQKSENCLLYEKILIKYGEKLNSKDKDVLAGLLIYKIGKFKTKIRDELLQALSYITGINIISVDKTLQDLDENQGIISYDSNNNTYDFIEDATGINDFNRFIRQKKLSSDAEPIELLINSEIKERLGILDIVSSDFGPKNNIKTSEWQYEQDILTIASIDKVFIENLIKDFKNKTSPDKIKGKLIYIYNNSYYELEYLERIQELYNTFNLNNYPFIFYLIDDTEDKFFDLLVNYRISIKFTEDEKIKYARFIPRFINNVSEGLMDVFKELQSKKIMIMSEGIIENRERLKNIGNSVFAKLYDKTIPFPFEGFSNKNISMARKILGNIARSLMSQIIDFQWIQTQSRDVRNRVDIVLKNNNLGWGVIDDEWNLVFPKNDNVRSIFLDLDDEFESKKELNLYNLYNKYIDIPYGLNDYSFSLLIAVYISLKGIEARLKVDSRVIKNSLWASEYFIDNKLNFKLLEDTKIIKVDIDGYVAKYSHICSLIEKNKDVDKCIELQEKLDALLGESDPPIELKDKVEACQILLNVGIAQYWKVQKTLASAKEDLVKGIRDIDYLYVFKAIEAAEKIGGNIEEDGNFKYNDNHVLEAAKISDRGRKHIEDNYLNFIIRVKCQSYAQVSGWENWMRKLSRYLIQLGYHDMANATRERILKVTDNLEKIKEQQNVIISTKEFLSTVRPTEFSGQEELLSWKKEAENLLEYLQGNKYFDDYEILEYKNKINTRLDEIKNKLDSIMESIGDILDRAFEITTLEEGKKLLSDIEYLITKKLRDIDKVDIENIGNTLQNMLKDIANIEKINRLTDRLNQVEILFDKYIDSEEYLNSNSLIEDYKNSILDELNKLRDIWKRNHLINNINEIQSWNSNKCITYINETEDLPYYLTEEIIIKYKNVKQIVEKRLSDLKIEGVISLFNKLSQDEKEECIAILKANIYN